MRAGGFAKFNPFHISFAENPEVVRKAKTDNKPAGKTNSSASKASLLLKWIPVIIFLFAFGLYSNTLNHGFVMDDGAVITDNKTVMKGFSGIKELFRQSSVYGSTGDNYGSYRPLTMTFIAIEWQFFGRNSSRYHLVHIMLYALSCVIVFFLLKNLLQDYHPLIPAVAALIFAAHPVHSEVAANIKSTDEILSLLLCSLSLLFYLRYCDNAHIKYLAGGVISFLAAIFSKESSITFLAIIPIALMLFTQADVKKIVILSALNLAAIAVLFAARHTVLEDTPDVIPVINNTLAGASGFNEKFGTIFIFLINYLRLLFFPHPLTWDYGYNHIPLTTFKNPLAVISALVYLSIAAYGVAIFIKHISKKTTDAKMKTKRLLAFLALFYIGSLSVYTNIFFLMASTMAERFLFVPSLAFCVLIAVIILKIAKYDISGRQNGNAIVLATILLLLVIPYSLKILSRNPDWKSNYTLFESGIKTSPGSYRANTTFAWENLIAGEKESDSAKKANYFTKAYTHFKKALSIFDKSPDDWYNFGVASGYTGREEEALQAYSRAASMNNHAKANYNLGVIYLKKGDYSKSLKHFLASYNKDPSVGDAAFSIGLCYQYLNEHEKAIPYYEKSYRKNPRNRDTVNNLVVAYRTVGKTDKENYYRSILEKLK